MNQKILIIGGYGRAGMEIAQLIARRGNYQILIGGRTLSKAKRAAAQLSDSFPQTHFEAVVTDINKAETVRETALRIDLVISAVPMEYKNTLILIDAILQSSGAHYIDLSPGNEKHKAFDDRSEQIDKGNHTFVLDAGFEPGLPGFMIHHLLAGFNDAQNVHIEAIYRDPTIPDGGIKDIIGHSQTAKEWINDHWKKVSSFKMKRIDFPHGFGKATAIPITNPEIEKIPVIYRLNKLSYYHAGINGVANAAMWAWQRVFRHVLPMQFGVNLFKWTIKKFTPEPYGGIITVTIDNQTRKEKMTLFHNQLYKATAIPVVATALEILDHENDKNGKYFMGEFVNQKRFLNELDEMGMSVSLN